MCRWQRALVALLILVGGTAAEADFPEWDRVSDVQTIEVLTFDVDGELRETPVWFVLLNGEAYLRTSNSRWLDNLRRDPNLRLRIEGVLYEAEAEEIPGQGILAKVDLASMRKYGLQEQLIHMFRFGSPQILRIFPRQGG
jgi:hypothetical protein